MLLADLIDFPELARATIALHDIDPERLETAESDRRGLHAHDRGRPAICESHLDRRPALEGADFVINEIQVGGLEATLQDFEIPARYGLRQTIGDTLGVGGIFRGSAHHPGDARDRPRYRRAVSGRVPAQLHQPDGDAAGPLREAGGQRKRSASATRSRTPTSSWREIVGVARRRFTYETAGVNHQAFVLRFERDGENLYPLLDEAIERDPDGLGRRVRIEMYRRWATSRPSPASTPPSTCRGSCVTTTEREHYRIPVDEYVRRSLDEHRRVRRDPPPASRGRAAGRSSPKASWRPATSTRSSAGEPQVEYGNVRNEGLIDNLPPRRLRRGSVPDRRRRHPPASRIGSLPPQCAALNRTFLNVAELTICAALEERRDHVHQAVMLDPNAAATLTTPRPTRWSTS